ncbi:MAG: uroporphyrinogen decarboxylase family protein [Pseudobdellovibrionaceae bacterium]
MNSKFKNAMFNKNLEGPPVWMMRQAGRYHKHYQNLRAKHSFMELCKEPELASEVALGPVMDFDFDVSIMFSDLLFPLEALGMGLDYTDSGPKLGMHLNPGNWDKLRSVEDALPALMFQKEVLKLTRQKIPAHKSVIGFTGGVWTLFVYAVEGGHSGSLQSSKAFLNLQKLFFERMTQLLIQNIQLQLDGGAEIVMIFDTAAGEVSPSYFKTLIAPWLIQLAQKFPGKLGYYSKGTQPAFFNQEFKSAPWCGVGVDHRWDLPAKLKLKEPGFVQGNFDQSLLFLETSDFKQHLTQYWNSYKELTPQERSNWVCGLGHGVLPKTPEKHVKYFVEYAREALG